MSYNTMPLVTTGDSWSAAYHNTYIRENLMETMPDKISATGDLVYGVGANEIARLALTPYSILTSGSAAPEWFEQGNPFHALRVNKDGDGYEWGDYPFIGEILSTTSGYSQAILANSDTPIMFGLAEIDQYSMWSSTASTYVIIPADFPANRWYKIQGYMYYSNVVNAGDNGYREIAVAVNGTVQEGMSVATGLMTEYCHMTFECERKLNPSDYLQMTGRCADSVGVTVYGAQLAVIMLR